VIALIALALAAQGTREIGELAITVDTQQVARESFGIGSGRLASGAPGWIVSATTRYDRVRPMIVLSPTIEISQDSLPIALQFDVANPREPVRVLGQLGRNRYTVRTVARSVERAREFPVQPPLVVLDDSVFTPYQVVAWFARPRPATLTAIFPRAPRRETLTLTDLGDDGGRRHVTIAGGANELVHIWLDATGRLLRVTIPSRRLVAERITSD
jgi:hypothetical protein